MKPETTPARLLAGKIVPPALPHPCLSRERLLKDLTESLVCCSATVIGGRAGTGKTTLAADFARTAGRRVAWFKVEAPDGDLSVFFRYLCESIAARRPGFGEQTTLRLGDSLGLEDVPLLVEYFVYELLQTEEPLLVVIDDLHLVYDESWVVPFFGRLLPLLPREVHLILVGRGLPPAPLWRMRSKQTLRVIEEPALAFTLQEACGLFNLYDCTAERAAYAWKETRGRAGLLAERARAGGAHGAAAARAARVGEGRAPHRLRLVSG
jgi:LuxR family maltose regulon positive regulatory protein